MFSSVVYYYRVTLSLIGLTAQPLITIHSNPVKLINFDSNLNSTQDDQEGKGTSLNEILDSCKSLKGDESWYTPTFYLANGHFSTIYCTLASFAYATCTYSRTYIEVPDGGTVALDFSPPLSEELPIDSRPILLILHGLTGGSHESYVIDIVNRIKKSKDEGGLGWRALVVNFRGCAGSPITSKKLYHGGYTNDLRCALAYLSSVAPKTPLYGIGFSLGANALARYVGEEGDKTPLKTAIILGAPWDFLDGHVCLSSSWLRRIYSKAMASNLRQLVHRHRHHFISDPRLDLPALFGNPHQTLYEFDSQVTRVLGGFQSTEAYYRYASASQLTQSMKIPLLSINAMDDPIVSTTTIPHGDALKNPNLVFVRTKNGGHLGWWENNWTSPRRWIGKPCEEWFRSIEKATGEKSYRKHWGVVVEGKEGMNLVEGDRGGIGEEVGCKVVEIEEREEIEEVGAGMIKGL